jgi:hypothetical protein
MEINEKMVLDLETYDDACTIAIQTLELQRMRIQ